MHLLLSLTSSSYSVFAPLRKHIFVSGIQHLNFFRHYLHFDHKFSDWSFLLRRASFSPWISNERIHFVRISWKNRRAAQDFNLDLRVRSLLLYPQRWRSAEIMHKILWISFKYLIKKTCIWTFVWYIWSWNENLSRYANDL